MCFLHWQDCSSDSSYISFESFKVKTCLYHLYPLTTVLFFVFSVLLFFVCFLIKLCLSDLQLAPCLALKTHQPVLSGACPPPIIMTRGTVCMEAHLGSLLAPAGLKGRTRGMRGIEGRTVRGETSPTSRMKKTGMTFSCF